MDIEIRATCLKEVSIDCRFLLQGGEVREMGVIKIRVEVEHPVLNLLNLADKLLLLLDQPFSQQVLPMMTISHLHCKSVSAEEGIEVNVNRVLEFRAEFKERVEGEGEEEESQKFQVQYMLPGQDPIPIPGELALFLPRDERKRNEGIGHLLKSETFLNYFSTRFSGYRRPTQEYHLEIQEISFDYSTIILFVVEGGCSLSIFQ